MLSHGALNASICLMVQKGRCGGSESLGWRPHIQGSAITIGQLAFHDCSSLANVAIQDNLLFIAGNAFDGCNALAMPASVLEGFGHFNIPEGTTTIVSRPPWQREGEDSWETWGVDKKA